MLRGGRRRGAVRGAPPPPAPFPRPGPAPLCLPLRTARPRNAPHLRRAENGAGTRPEGHAWGGTRLVAHEGRRDGSAGPTVGNAGRRAWGESRMRGHAWRRPGALTGRCGVPGPAGAVRALPAAPGFSSEISPSPPDVSPVPGCRTRGRAGGRAGRTGRTAEPAAPGPTSPSRGRGIPGRAPPPHSRRLGAAPRAAPRSRFHGPCPLHFLPAGFLRLRGQGKQWPLFFFFLIFPPERSPEETLLLQCLVWR